MRELIDAHVHTAACGHASGTVAQMVGAAVVGGVSGVVFAEHLPLPEVLNPDGSFAPSEQAFMRYAAEVAEIAARVRGLEVVLGAEGDWLPARPEAMEAQRAIAARAGVAVLVGSVHFLGDWPHDSPDHLAGWDERGTDAVWEEYFSAWCDAARSGLFVVMAHPDLPKKFGRRPTFDPALLYDEAARAARDGGVLIEVSTAGLRKPVEELYPGPELLAAFRRHRVPATVGSDAHDPAEVGWGIDRAYAALAGAGYERVAFPRGGGELRWVDL